MKKKVLSLMLAVLMICLAVPFAVSAEDTVKADLEIGTPEQLLDFASKIKGGDTFDGKTIVLTSDIQLNGENFSAGEVATDGTITAPVAPTNQWPVLNSKAFNGTFDGQGHYISGIYAKGTQVSIFGTGGKNACVKNLAIVNSYVECTSGTCGGIFSKCNVANSKIQLQNLYVNINIKGVGSHIGGLIGYTSMAGSITIENTVFAGNIDCNLDSSNKGSNIGGFIGAAFGHATTTTDKTEYTIRNSAFYGNLTNKENYASALIGRLANNSANKVDMYCVENCIVAGNVRCHKTGSTNASSFFAINNIDSSLYTVSIDHSLYTAVKTGSNLTSKDQPIGIYTKEESIQKKDYHLVTDENLIGLEAQKLLDDNQLTEWIATFGHPIPKALDGMIPENENTKPEPPVDAEIRYVGYQMSAAANGSVNIRLVGVVDEDDLQYEQVGFRVVAYYVDQQGVRTPSKNYATKTVYTSLYGTDNATLITYNPQDYDGAYFFALNCNNVKTTLGKITFRISTFYVADGETVYDADYEFTVSFAQNNSEVMI